MGYYIEVERNHDKAGQIIEKYKGVPRSFEEARDLINDPTIAIIVVVDNGPYEAAAFAYNEAEFKRFTDGYFFVTTHLYLDRYERLMEFISMPRDLAKQLTNYSGE